jgi:hypothetical protein
MSKKKKPVPVGFVAVIDWLKSSSRIVSAAAGIVKHKGSIMTKMLNNNRVCRALQVLELNWDI